MNLIANPNAAVALFIDAGPRSEVIWNGHVVPPYSGYTGDMSILFEQVRLAWAEFAVEVTTVAPAGKPYFTIGLTNVFGNYPGGGQANVDSWQAGGINAWVFVDRLGGDPRMIGLDAAHESGHVAGGFSDYAHVDPSTGGTIYEPGFYMGLPWAGTPNWRDAERLALASRFGWSGDQNKDGVVNFADAFYGRDAHNPVDEMIATVRAIPKGK